MTPTDLLHLGSLVTALYTIGSLAGTYVFKHEDHGTLWGSK